MRRIVKQVTQIAGRYEVKVVIEPSLFAQIFGAKNKTFTYHGSGGSTAWRQFPSGNRASSWMEAFLFDAVIAHKTRNEALSPA